MSTPRSRPSPARPVRPRLLAVAASLSILAACGEATPTAPPPLAADRVSAAESQLLVLKVELAGPLEGRWTGSWTVDGSRGEVVVEAVVRDGTDIRATWTVYPPDPIHPPDPIYPPDPIHPLDPRGRGEPLRVDMRGTLDPERGRMSLAGMVDEAGQTWDAIVEAEAAVGLGGSLDALGTLSFNPQPEPPAGS